MKILFPITISVATLLTSGCASIPSISMNYYLAKTVIDVKVIQTVGCDAANVPVVVVSPVVTTVHSADYANGPEEFKAYQLNSQFADTDMKFTFYEDGRLKGTEIEFYWPR